MKSILDDLNDEQRLAVTSSFDEPLFVYAGAGSGKTRTLICRIANMINNGINPENILAITFTRKAAEEIQERIKQFVGPRGAQVSTLTFHRLSLNILRNNPFILPFGRKSDFKIADTKVQSQIIQNACKQLRFTSKELAPNALRILTSKMLNFVRRAKTLFKTPEDYQGDLQFVFQFYQDKLKEHSLIDFYDFLTYTENLLKHYPRVAHEYRKMYRYILIDEFQDTSSINFNIIKLILGSQSKRITIVGDIRQSIYGFRGANPMNIGQFLEFYPDAHRVILNRNYRSTQTILNAAQSLISNCNTNVDFSAPLISTKERGDLIKIIRAEDSLSEVDQICSEIEKLVYPGSLYQYRDIVIMFRMKKISADIEMELFRRNIPYTTKRGIRFFMRREIRELISYIRLLLNFNNDESDPNMLLANAIETVINVPNRNIGEKPIKFIKEKSKTTRRSMLYIIKHLTEKDVGKVTLKKFESFTSLLSQLHNQICVVNQNLSTDSALELIIKMAKLDDEEQQMAQLEGSTDTEVIEEINDMFTEYINNRKETFEMLNSEAKRFHKQLLQMKQAQENPSQMTSASNLKKFINSITLEDGSELNKNAVTLSTIHQMKGLESPICFLMRFNQGVLPINDKSENENDAEGLDSVQSLEEERRIAYVAMTRAKDKLYISMCSSWKGRCMEFSQFLSEINSMCLTNQSSLSAKDKEEINKLLQFDDDDFDDLLSS